MKEFQDGDPLFGAMMHAIANLWPNGTAVLSGCAPTGSGSARQVTVAGGTVVINGTVVSISQQTKTLDAATFDRYDLVSINTSGQAIVTKGVDTRRVPPVPANSVPIAICLVETGQTALPTDRIYDTRMDAFRLSSLNINADKNWNRKNITNLGKISPISWLAVTGNDPLLISKTGNPSTTVSFTQQVEKGNIKIVALGEGAGYYYGLPQTRVFHVYLNGDEIWSQSQGLSWDGEQHYYSSFSAIVDEDLVIEPGDALTLSVTGVTSSVTMEIYATPIVAPYGLVV